MREPERNRESEREDWEKKRQTERKDKDPEHSGYSVYMSFLVSIITVHFISLFFLMEWVYSVTAKGVWGESLGVWGESLLAMLSVCSRGSPWLGVMGHAYFIYFV